MDLLQMEQVSGKGRWLTRTSARRVETVFQHLPSVPKPKQLPIKPLHCILSIRCSPTRSSRSKHTKLILPLDISSPYPAGKAMPTVHANAVEIATPRIQPTRV